MVKNDNICEFDKRPIGVIVECIIVFIIVLLFVALTPQPHFCHRDRHGEQKKCFRNQNILIVAVEMYNLDCSQKIEYIDSKTYDVLIERLYLKEDFFDLSDCKYFSEGNISDEGYIYCKYHGSQGHEDKATDYERKVISKKDKRDAIINKMIICAFCLVAPIIMFALSLIPFPSFHLFSK